MNSFNAFKSRKAIIGGNTPIWLGVLAPVPVGGVLDAYYIKPGIKYAAGTPAYYDDANKKVYPFVAWKVKSIDTTYHILTVYAEAHGFEPEADDFITPVGATFATTGAAGKVSAVAASATEGCIDITFTDAKLDGVSANSFIAFSSADAVASSGKSLAHQPNGYIGRDIYIDPLRVDEVIDDAEYATADIVMYHHDGILIDRTPAKDFKAQMASVCPGVYQKND